MYHHPFCYAASYCGPVMFMPVAWPQTLVREIDVDTTTTTAQSLVGGNAPVRLTVEYLMQAGGPAASVSVKVTTDGQTVTWSETAITSGFHVNDLLPPAKPGSTVALDASGALARVRWCEMIFC